MSSESAAAAAAATGDRSVPSSAARLLTGASSDSLVTAARVAVLVDAQLEPAGPELAASHVAPLLPSGTWGDDGGCGGAAGFVVEATGSVVAGAGAVVTMPMQASGRKKEM